MFKIIFLNIFEGKIREVLQVQKDHFQLQKVYRSVELLIF